MAGVITVRLPDGSTEELRRGHDGADLAPIHRAAAGQGGRGGHRRRRDGRPRHRAARRRRGGGRHRGLRRRARRAPPLHRPRAGPGRARLWPGAHYAIGPVIEDGFYYDFELPGGAHFSDDDLERIEAEMRGHHRRGPALRARGARPRRGSGALRRPALQARDHRGGRRRARDEVDAGHRADGAVSAYRNADAFIDLCRGPHVPSTGRLGPLQAHAGGRRLLARRREAPAAPAHLRHRLGVGEGPGRAPAPARGGRAARPPQARRRARPVLASPTRSARGWPSSTPRAARSAG